MSLNDTKIRHLKPLASPFKVSDAHGLCLLVNPNGSRRWYLKYRINHKASRLALGAWPDVSLAEARKQRENIRRLLAMNINPAQQRNKDNETNAPALTFKTVALDGHQSHRRWSDNHATRRLASITSHIFPLIGEMPIDTLKPRHFINILNAIEKKDYWKCHPALVSICAILCGMQFIKI